jgi:uncharacterized protein (TIGR01370 family)
MPRTSSASGAAIAIYYGDSPDVSALGQFPRVVIEPDHLDAAGLAELQRRGSAVFAYVSVGEADRARAGFAQIDRRWILGEDRGWNSVVMDPAQVGWRQLVLERLAELYRRGYRGFFLDTLDAWRSVIHAGVDEPARLKGLVQLIGTAHERFPDARILLNRGFELLPDVHGFVDGVVAESLFAGWNATTHTYVPVSPADRAWLLKKLLDARKTWGLDVVSVDYVPLEERERAREVAARIHALGIVPWVAPADLGALGVGELEVIPRRIVALYDGQAEGDWRQTRIHRFVQMPFEHLGYFVDPIDVRSGLPPPLRRDQVAGLVTWFPGELPASLRYGEWLRRTVAGGVRVAAFGGTGTSDSEALTILGLQRVESVSPPLTVTALDSLAGFEAPLSRATAGISFWKAVGAHDVSHLVLADTRGKKVDAIVTGPWGGFAAEPEILEPGYAGRRRWILDPFAFLRAAFPDALPLAPDATTESGRRILVVAVAADTAGLRADLPGRPVAAAVVIGDLLRRGLPFSLSEAPERVSPLIEAASTLAAGHPPIIEDMPSLTNVSPLGSEGSSGFVVYAPGESEKDGTAIGAAYALDPEPIIARLEATGAPRRLKPVGITLRTGVVVEPAGRKTLGAVLDWIHTQPLTPLWTSEYVARAAQFRRVVLLRDVEGAWHLRDTGPLRTFRADVRRGWPEPGSGGVSGVNDTGEGRYLIVDGRAEPVVRFRRSLPSGTSLDSANGVLDVWSPGADGIRLRMHGHRPLQIAIRSQARQCRLTEGRESWSGSRNGANFLFSLRTASLHDATLRCR